MLALDATGKPDCRHRWQWLGIPISPAGEGFVLYSAPKKEITALALDREATSTLRASARGAPEPSPSSGDSSTSLDGPRASVPAGSQRRGRFSPHAQHLPFGPFPVSRRWLQRRVRCLPHCPRRFPSRIWTSREDIVYALAFDSHDRLLAGTGNRGHVFAIEGQDEFADLLKAPASQVTGFAKAPGGGLYAASSNLGKIFLLGPGPRVKALMRAMFSMPRFFRVGAALNSAEPAMSTFWRAAATSTIPTATGVPGSKWI